MKRIVISLPDYQVAAIEKICRTSRIPRSRVILSAIDRYLSRERLSGEVRRYEEGYRKKPERVEAIAHVRTAVSVLTSEKWTRWNRQSNSPSLS